MSSRIKNAEQSMEHILNMEINNGQLAGAGISVIYQGEKVIHKCLGYADIENQRHFTEDTIFRIYSMSKPIAAVATMIQVERGLIDILAPVSEYLPEFKNMMVLKDDGLVKAKRQILIKDLLHMTSGIVYPDQDDAGTYMQRLFDEIQERLEHGEAISTRQLCKLIAEQPLAFQPGKQWRYGLSVDVMGAVIEETAQMSLSDFYQTYIFEPLDMKDTGFYVEPDKQERFAQLYKYEDNKLVIDKDRHLCLTSCLKPPSFESAGAGVVSTMNDYNNFAQMLVNYGTFKDAKILSKKSIELFQQNHLSKDQLSTASFDTSIGYGYGNFMRVYKEPKEAQTLGSIGEFGWDGWTGPYVTVNPMENLTIVMMLQRSGYTNPALIRKIRNIAYSIL
ncbi:serine hydrolase domain-containing protein [Candidatus Galacturonibacter soehngenii]|uniref:Beta-lactamase family protein n=1 Tax=Candidatus Galacturonatibacter soehngenii TaxID=2307010 RepID=A0A7V7QMF1_9FIRM|nr:serine hydrolase domain-containing protein [Candidatus Galacturonibacter soehngenii]KAB1439398.1 beta-lactamase family protein [Candidatus Galacturonibacter soehngenii]